MPDSLLDRFRAYVKADAFSTGSSSDAFLLSCLEESQALVNDYAGVTYVNPVNPEPFTVVLPQVQAWVRYTSEDWMDVQAPADGYVKGSATFTRDGDMVSAVFNLEWRLSPTAGLPAIDTPSYRFGAPDTYWTWTGLLPWTPESQVNHLPADSLLGLSIADNQVSVPIPFYANEQPTWKTQIIEARWLTSDPITPPALDPVALTTAAGWTLELSRTGDLVSCAVTPNPAKKTSGAVTIPEAFGSAAETVTFAPTNARYTITTAPASVNVVSAPTAPWLPSVVSWLAKPADPVPVLGDPVRVSVVPEAVLERAYLECASELYQRRSAPQGVSQFASPDGGTVPVSVGRDPMSGARLILQPYLPGGFA